VSMTDDDDDDDDDYDAGYEMDECALAYTTVEEANASFVERVHGDLVTNYGEREHYYIGNLYYDMFTTVTTGAGYDPDTGEDFLIKEHFWIMPVQHPIAIIIQDHFDQYGEHDCCAKYTTPYGDFVVYDQTVMTQWTEAIAEMFTENGHALLRRSPNAQPLEATPTPVVTTNGATRKPPTESADPVKDAILNVESCGARNYVPPVIPSPPAHENKKGK